MSTASDKCRLFCRLCRIVVACVAFKEKNKKNTSLRGILQGYKTKNPPRQPTDK